MYCEYCGKMIPNGGKFCPACGASVTKIVAATRTPEPAKKIIKCRSCDSTMQIRATDHLGACPFCTSQDLLDVSEEENRRFAALKAAEEQKRKEEEAEALRKMEEQQKAEEQRASVEKFARGKLGWYIRYSMMAAMLLLVIACFMKSPFAILVSVIQVAILIVDWLIGTGIIRKPFFGFVPIVMFLVWMMTFGYLYGMFSTVRVRVQEGTMNMAVQEMEVAQESTAE